MPSRILQMKFTKFIPAAIAILGLTAPAYAATSDAPCGVADVAALDTFAAGLQGQWTSTFKAGYVVAGAMVMAHPAAPAPETGSIEFRGGRLTIVPDSSDGIPVSFDWETGVDWRFDSQPALAGTQGLTLPDLGGISSEDISLGSGCDVNDRPRLVGTAMLPIQGGQMTFVLRLIVLHTNLIYGFQQVHGVVNGHSVVERRVFIMTR